MWHKAKWMGRPMRLELTRVGLLVYLANRYTTRGALANNYKSSYRLTDAKPEVWGTLWESHSLMMICLPSLLIIKT